MADQRLAIVTGASSGLGLESARALAASNYQVLMVSRGEEKLLEAANQIRGELPEANISEYVLDVSNLDQVRAFAKSIEGGVDILMNNAGLMGPPFALSKDGIELQMATNHVGHFLLTKELFENLNSVSGRVVSLSSVVHRRSRLSGLDAKMLEGANEKGYDRWQRYADTKLACLLFGRELDLRLKQSGSRALSVIAHPGWAITGLQKHTPHTLDPLAQDAKTGARSQILAATDNGLQGGEFFGPSFELWGSPKKIKGSKTSQDLQLSKKLWEATEELIGIKFLG